MTLKEKSESWNLLHVNFGAFSEKPESVCVLCKTATCFLAHCICLLSLRNRNPATERYFPMCSNFGTVCVAVV